MTPTVPSLISHLYAKKNKNPNRDAIDTSGLPKLETYLRDNVTGIIWKVFAHTGEDIYISSASNHEPVSLKAPKRERMVILQSVNPSGTMMHLPPEVLDSRISSHEHFEVHNKRVIDIPRFEMIDSKDVQGKKRSPFSFWQRGIETLEPVEALRALEGRGSFYILNVFATSHGLVDLLISESPSNRSVNIRATWIPQDILSQMSREELLKSRAFRQYLNEGYIVAITNRSAKMIQDLPEFAEEEGRVALVRNIPNTVRSTRIQTL